MTACRLFLEAKDFEQWVHGDVKDAATLMKPAAEDALQKVAGIEAGQ